MDKLPRILVVDDSDYDTKLIIREIKKYGYNPYYERVDNAQSMKKALSEGTWDMILCDFNLREFNAPSAINILMEENYDIPLIVISGNTDEYVAAECMRVGARDYVMKNNLSRLPAAINRELESADVRIRQKKAEEALRQMEEKHRNFIDNIEEGYYEINLNGNFVFFNDAVCQMLGYSRDELPGMNFKQFTDKENSNELFDEFNKVYNTGKPIKEFDWQVIRKDGDKRYIRGSISLQKDSSGKPLLFKGILRDVTESKFEELKIQQTINNLTKAIGATMQVMVAAVETRDPYTYGHQFRSTNLACSIASDMNLDPHMIDGVKMAGSIYDIGKLSIPAEILSKPSRLTNIEISMIKEHVRNGYEMLKNVESPWPLAEIVYQHHERMNGSGYPRNLAGDEILMESRILGVSDVVESMASRRPYRPALGLEVALEEIEKNKGILYDSDVVESCLKLFREGRKN